MTVELTTAQSDLLIALAAAHLLGDFVLQTDRMVRAKTRPGVVLVHAGIVSGVSWVLVGHFTVLWIPASILVTHFFIDWSKAGCGVLLQRASRQGRHGFLSQNGALLLFVVDQAAHFLVIGTVVWAAEGVTFLSGSISGVGFWPDPSTQALLVLSGWLFTALATGHLLELYLERFESQLTDEQRGGLTNGGYWIGVTERSLIFLFIIAGEPAGIGFLAAAKSVFRIGELKESEDRKLAEYILIGTLMSFTIAMTGGLLTRWILDALA